MRNKLFNIGLYKGRIVWASKKTIKYAYGNFYIQEQYGLKKLNKNQEKRIKWGRY